nr:hypothetical protein [Neisseria meningitidis]
MLSQSQWLDAVKGRLRVRSDYALSKRWAVTPSEVSQYRRNRLRFPFAVVLDIADVMDIDPIEIIAGLEYRRCREKGHGARQRGVFQSPLRAFCLSEQSGLFPP